MLLSPRIHEIISYVAYCTFAYFFFSNYLAEITQPPRPSKRTKIINDPVHGSIEVNDICMMLIDTPQFQRLRHIKHLGGCSYVYPGASHTRFEHSIGVYHLAGQFVRMLQQTHPERNITEKDILCVEIAALCHDLGHGPFSHVYEKQFIPKVLNQKWTHEEAPVKMFEFLLDNNPRVKEKVTEKLDERCLTFIKEMMNPPKYNGRDYPYEGRDDDKQFLYEIVNNNRNKIDADKWDYFARDCHMLGIKNTFDHIRYMKFARIINIQKVPEGELRGWQICMRDKEAENLYDMFHTRMSLYRRAYYHKDTRGVEVMIAEALQCADNFVEKLGIRSDGNTPRKISRCKEDPAAYLHLTDSIYYLIMYADIQDENMKRAKNILRSIEARCLYKCVAQASQRNGPKLKPAHEEKIRKDIIETNTHQGLSVDDIVVCILDFCHDKEHSNPMERVRFYRKGDEENAHFLLKEEVSHMLPSVFEETVVAVYCKYPHDPENCQRTVDYFKYWCDNTGEQKMEKPKIWLGTSANWV